MPRRRASAPCSSARRISRRATLLALADALREATRRHGARLLVNDRADVALAVGADGVQRTHASLPVAALRAITPARASSSAPPSIRSPRRGRRRAGRRLRRLRPGLRHAVEAAVRPAAGAGRARGASPPRCDRPVLAVGGITPERVRRGARGRRRGRRGDRRDLRGGAARPTPRRRSSTRWGSA